MLPLTSAGISIADPLVGPPIEPLKRYSPRHSQTPQPETELDNYEPHEEGTDPPIYRPTTAYKPSSPSVHDKRRGQYLTAGVNTKLSQSLAGQGVFTFIKTASGQIHVLERIGLHHVSNDIDLCRELRESYRSMRRPFWRLTQVASIRFVEASMPHCQGLRPGEAAGPE
jgi:hypothetical protein